MTSPYEQLRTRINELLPDRLKLEFGCELRHLKSNDWTRTVVEFVPKIPRKETAFVRLADQRITEPDYFWEQTVRDEYEILGKPIDYTDDVERFISGNHDLVD